MMEELQRGLWECSTGRRPGSSFSTPYESATCSPRSSTDIAMSCFFSTSTPTSPVQVTLDIDPLASTSMGFVTSSSINQLEEPSSDDFDFSARFSETDQAWSMSSADELFCNGQIRPLWHTDDSADWYSLPLEHHDDDTGYHFRSSADYKFTMLPPSLTHVPALSNLERPVGYKFSSQSQDRCLHGPRHNVSTEDAINKEGDMLKTSESLLREDSRRLHPNSSAKQDVKVKVEESRGRSASGSKEGGIRRTRSLSPMRVFHMDDELPKQFFEAHKSTQPTTAGQANAGQEEEWQGVGMVRQKGERMTLKELLIVSEQAEQAVWSKGLPWTGSKQQARAPKNETTLNERSTLWFKPMLKHSLQNNSEASKHLMHVQAPRSPNTLRFSSPRIQSEQMRQQTFLPYRHGLLGCLGFTSKGYRSVAGFRSFHSKSQGTRYVTGYDTTPH